MVDLSIVMISFIHVYTHENHETWWCSLIFHSYVDVFTRGYNYCSCNANPTQKNLWRIQGPTSQAFWLRECSCQEKYKETTQTHDGWISQCSLSHLYIYIYMYMNIHVCVYIYICIFICIYTIVTRGTFQRMRVIAMDISSSPNCPALLPSAKQKQWLTWTAMLHCQHVPLLNWLVVWTPLKNMSLVSWHDEIPNVWNNKIHVPNHQPSNHFGAFGVSPLY